VAEFTGELTSSARIQSELMIVCFLAPVTLEGLPAPVFNLGIGKDRHKNRGLVQMMINKF
jgi:hypothetical protein